MKIEERERELKISGVEGKERKEEERKEKGRKEKGRKGKGRERK